MDYDAHTPGRPPAASNDSASPRKRPSDHHHHDDEEEDSHKTPRGSLLSRLFSPGSSSRLCSPNEPPLFRLGEGVNRVSFSSNEDELRGDGSQRELKRSSTNQGSPLVKAASVVYGSLQRRASRIGFRMSGSWPNSPRDGEDEGDGEKGDFALPPPRTIFGVDDDFHLSSKRFENKRLRRGL
ncbi:hypothetical protein BASA81_014036 [Batrachochytrium salamandrivorans]|nr:hypothetical protein BASA81_014036 [Batrachochytrium salamandrivorans]